MTLKMEFIFIYKKNFGPNVFLRTISHEHKSPFSSYIIYHYFYPDIFMFGIELDTYESRKFNFES